MTVAVCVEAFQAKVVCLPTASVCVCTRPSAPYTFVTCAWFRGSTTFVRRPLASYSYVHVFPRTSVTEVRRPEV